MSFENEIFHECLFLWDALFAFKPAIGTKNPRVTL